MKGATLLEQQTGQSSSVLKIDGGTFPQGQTEPALAVEGTTTEAEQYVVGDIHIRQHKS
ncbi:MAG: hypothetical protein IPG71_08475 [bacterium]|nr:hypothetical protein [bacterium]